MAHILSWDLVLTGANRGRTVVLQGFPFVKGRLELTGNEQSVHGVTKLLGKCYQAYPEHSEALAKAQARDRELYGESDIQAGEQRDEDDTVSASGVRPAGAESTPEIAVFGSGDGGSETWGSGSFPDGNGHEDAGFPGGEDSSRQNRVSEALAKLNPADDEDWTALGLPAIAAVERYAGRAGVTRAMVEAVAPDFRRSTDTRSCDGERNV